MLDPSRGPITPMWLADYRDEVAGFPMTAQERSLVLDQAQLLIDKFYVHLDQKQAMYGVDPGRQLRLLARSQRELDDPSFHQELMRIFDALRDMHTTYVLPEPYRGRVLLGFGIEYYWDRDRDRDRRRYIVSKPGHGDDRPLPEGAEITRWNGVPIEEAVLRNAALEAGGNAAARFARGLESLTLRNAALSPLPSEDRVHIRYVWDGKPAKCVVRWRVEADPDGLPPEIDGDRGTAAQRLGYSMRTEMVRQLKTHRLRAKVSDPDDTLHTSYESQVRARVVRTGSGAFGHLRVYSFKLPDQDVERFLAEMGRLLEKMPSDGLIVDVRGNPGGHIEAAEGLLALLTTRDVQPEPMQFVNSPLTYELCGQSGDLFPWRRSIGESEETGARHSATLPLSVPATPSRPYRGPVVLITDALVYSATDMFAAGFQDNGIGWILGVDDNTGAGGANVWNVPLLRQVWPKGPLQPMPRQSRLTFALRRSLRVGQSAGRPVEDLGVSPDVRYRMTLADLREQNVDLLNQAGRLLVDLRRDREQH